MYVRLAFAVATSIDPEILVIDEALSVGDGAFARRSFDRIMELKARGVTILFCSHSTYHVEALCERAVWLEAGRVRMLDSAPAVTAAYNTALALESATAHPDTAAVPMAAAAGTGRIVKIEGECDGVHGRHLKAVSQRSTLSVTVEFATDPALPAPNVALGFESAAGVAVSSVVSLGNPAAIVRDGHGNGQASVVFPALPLLKGSYRITAFLACEHGLHVYDAAPQCLTLDVEQEGVLQGLVVLPHHWNTTHG
jgi:lipopolysaccharide transport system ATP-binding protein